MSWIDVHDPPCWYSHDHRWLGSSICTACGERLRCGCGQFVREDSFDEHFKRCPSREIQDAWERSELESRMG